MRSISMSMLRSGHRLSNMWLFLLLSSFFVIFPIASRSAVASSAVNVLLTLAVLLAIYIQFSSRNIARVLFTILGLVTIVINWLPLNAWGGEFLAPITYSAFFFCCVGLYCYRLFNARDVDADTLFAAGCAYILIGFFFASLYRALLHVNPDAISLPTDTAQPIYDLTYFSFVTLTTLGYGDVIPVSYTARMLAAYEAIAGQIFMTVAIAELVGVHVAQKRGQQSM